ncbi:MAG: hypothetical protein Q9227_009471 [Pyrenula ochraceoflavens]
MAPTERSGPPDSSIEDTPGAFPTDEEPVEITLPQSTSQAVKARRSEYTKKEQIKIKVGTWNVASLHGTEKDLQGWFVEGKGILGLSEDITGLSITDNHSEDDDKNSGNGHRIEMIESTDEQEARRAKKKVTLPKEDVSALPAGDEVDLYVLGLQEIVDVSSITEAFRLYADPAISKKWKDAMQEALPGYEKVAEQQLIGLLLLVYASPRIIPSISSVSTTSVPTGFSGYMGNKGCAAARIVLGETTRLIFINSHLAAGADKAAIERRNWDYNQITQRTKFEPILDSTGDAETSGDKIGDEDFAFWFGDLNYRLDDMPGEDVRRLLLLHTRNEYDTNNMSKRKIDSEIGYVDPPKEDLTSPTDSHHSFQESDTSSITLDPRDDPASLHTTLQSLLPHDQLYDQQDRHNAFHEGWREGEINFLPTYKYDVGSIGMFDSGEKKRGPSWCDRILYRTRNDRLEYLERVKQQEEARKRDEEMTARGLDKPEDNDVLFDYDPDYDYEDDSNAPSSAPKTPRTPRTPKTPKTPITPLLPTVETSTGFEDVISLDQYVSHQRVLSSDHKPLDAVFTLTYDAVDVELRARVHQEVAREMDKAENEGRPGITVVSDRHHERDMFETDNSNASPIQQADGSRDDQAGLEFGQVRFMVPKQRALTIANTGGVPAEWCFIDRQVVEDIHGGILPPWLTMTVERDTAVDKVPIATKPHTLQPGETAIVNVHINVKDFDFVSSLNQGKAVLEDVLVLRVTNGKDHFIPVNGSWLPSCFCRTLEDLTLETGKGIRGPDISKGSSLSPTTSPSTERPRLSAPRELFALTEAVQELPERVLAEHSMISPSDSAPPPWSIESDQEDWPFHSSNANDLQQTELEAFVREALDTATPLNQCLSPETLNMQRLEALASTLLLFLRSLQDGIFTPASWQLIENNLLAAEKAKKKPTTDEIQSWTQEVLGQRPVASVCWTFIVFMLKRVLDEVAPAPTFPNRTSEEPPRSSEEQQQQQQQQQPRTSTSSRTSQTSSQPSEVALVDSSSPSRPHPVPSTSTSFFGSFRGRRSRATTEGSTSSTATTTMGAPASLSAAASAELEAKGRAERRRQTVRRAYAGVFAEAVVRWEVGGKAKGIERERERKAREERRRGVVEAFLM